MFQDLGRKDTNVTIYTTENELCSSMFLDSNQISDYFTGTLIFASFLIPAPPLILCYFKPSHLLHLPELVDSLAYIS